MSDLPVMKFKIKEKVKLSNEEQSFNELSSLEIEPVIKVRDLEKQVEVEGYLVLYGEFNIRNQYLEKNLDQFDALHFDSALNNYKIDSFQHRIPLSIKIDSKRVKDLSQIIVEVENFDYQIISNQEIEISSELKLLGINQANMVEEKISKEKNKSDFTNDIEHKSIKNIEVDKEIKKIIQEEKKEDYFKNKNDSEYPMYPLIKNIENQDINKKDITDDEGSYPDIFANNDNEENETLETKSKSKDMDETEEDNRGSENGTKTMLYGLLSGNENSQYKIKMYFVQKEDSIDEIANKYEVNSIDVISLNKLEDNNIKVGQILYLPIKK